MLSNTQHTLTRSHTHLRCIHTHTQAVYSLDVPRWQTVTNESVQNTFRSRCILPPPPIPLLFITSTRATQPSSLSTAPIHQHTAITCLCPMINCFSCADALAYQTLRKWQIRSLCPFMIMFSDVSVFIQCKFVGWLYEKHSSLYFQRQREEGECL